MTPVRDLSDPGFRIVPAALAERAQLVAALTERLESELSEAVGRGVLSQGEAEQLLARLHLVVDQAIGPRP